MIQKINNGITGAQAAELLFQNDKNVAAIEWSAADVGATYPTIRTFGGVTYIVKQGLTATADRPDVSKEWVTVNADNILGNYSTEWGGMVQDMPAQLYPAWQGVKLVRGETYKTLEIGFVKSGAFDINIVDAGNNIITKKSLTSTGATAQSFELNFTAPEDRDSYLGISTGVTNLYKWDDGASAFIAAYAEGGIVHELPHIRKLSFYLTTGEDLKIDTPDGLASTVYVDEKIGVKKAGFKPLYWNFANSFFTSSGVSWHGFKATPNTQYNRIVVFADKEGPVSFHYADPDGVYTKRIASATLKYGYNYLPIDLYVGALGGFIGIRTAGNTVKYGEGAPSSIVAYSYDGYTVQASVGRVFKFYAETAPKIDKPTRTLYNEIVNLSNQAPDITGAGGIWTDEGFWMNTPNSDPLKLNKYFALNNRSLYLRFWAADDSAVAIGSNVDGMAYIVDVAGGKIKYKVNGAFVEVAASFLNTHSDIIAQIKRFNNKVDFIVTQGADTASISRTFDGEGGSGAGSINPNPTNIALNHDKYIANLYSGTGVVFRQFTVIAGVSDVDLIMYGDSITEPEFYYPAAKYAESWPQLVINEIASRKGKAVASGRSSTNIVQLLDRIKNELPYIKAKYVMITIGTNGGNTESNLSQLVEYIISQGSMPILNNIPCNENATQITANKLISAVRKKYGIKGVKFDLPTSLAGDGATVDTSTMYWEDYGIASQIYHHPNPKGAKLMFMRIFQDTPEIF